MSSGSSGATSTGPVGRSAAGRLFRIFRLRPLRAHPGFGSSLARCSRFRVPICQLACAAMHRRSGSSRRRFVRRLAFASSIAVSSLRLLTASSATADWFDRRSSSRTARLAIGNFSRLPINNPTHDAFKQSTIHIRSHSHKQQRRQKEDHQDDHDRRAKQFAPRRPRNLVHLSFDGNQKIGKVGICTTRKLAHKPNRQHRQRHSTIVQRVGSPRSL